MLETHLEYLSDVVVLEGVVALFAVGPYLYQILLPEDAELMGYGALLHADDIGDTADAELALEQRAHYPYAGRVAEDLEEIRKLKEGIGVGHITLDDGDYVLVFFMCHKNLRVILLYLRDWWADLF